MANLNSASTKSLANRIVKAVDKDEKADGCDISAGLFGTELSSLIVHLATLLETAKGMAEHVKATDEYGDCEAELEAFEELVEMLEGDDE
jgi:hypothetical protein